MIKEHLKQSGVKKNARINIGKTFTRSVFFLLLFVLIHNRAAAQPATPVEIDTLAPFVTTSGISVFTSSAATMGGNVTGSGGANVTERGVVYSTVNATPTVGDTKLIIGNGTGIYSQSVSGLTGGTVYYVRAYATNIIGTSYGAVVSFTTLPAAPVITTNEVSAITNTTATVGGNISFSGGAAVTERGVVFSTANTIPTVADTKLVMGLGTGNFSGSMTGLIPGTVYYVRAYAVNAAGTSYGAVFSFMPAGASVSTNAVSEVTTNSVRAGGNITSVGGSPVTDRGIVYMQGNGTPSLADARVSMGAGSGVFSQTVTSLQPATTYSVRAYATNSAVTNYGAIQIFTTQTTLLSINRIEASPTNLNVVTYAVTFAQSVTGVTVDNFAVTTTGSIVNSYVTAVTGAGTAWNVTVYTGRNNGTLTLLMANANGIEPLLSNALPFNGQVFVIDRTAPVYPYVSIRSGNADTTRAKTGDIVTLSFNANETITTPVVTIAGQAAAVTSTGVNKWAATYTMRNTDTEGIIAFTVNANDLAGNAAAMVNATTNATAVTFDRTALNVLSINRADVSPTNANSVQYTVTFAEPVTGVDASDFALTVSLLTGASITSVAGTGAVYTVTVNTGAGNGTIRLDLNAAGTGITDLAGNNITGGFTNGQVYTIAKILTKPTVKVTDPVAVCFPATVDLTAAAVTAGSDPGLTYSYYTDAAATIPLTTPSAVGASGQYYITGTNIVNITSDPVPVNVTVNNFTNPKAGFIFDSYCLNKAVNFTNTSSIAGSGAVNYQWTDNNGHNSTLASPSFTYATTGNYSVKLKVSSQLCPLVADSITQNIGIVSPVAGVRLPLVNIIANDNNRTQLQARTNVGNTYQWAPGTGLSSAAVSNPLVMLAQQTAYTITITAASGCQTVDSLLVRVFDKHVYVPNIFSPNGDGVNDILFINLISVTQLRYFRIYNRYGKKVFETSDPNTGWDGKLNGQLQPLDTYIWMMEGVNKNNNQVSQQGNVTLIR